MDTIVARLATGDKTVFAGQENAVKVCCRYAYQDLANRWGISVRTLQDWRYKKTGPEFIKFGGWTVRYPLKAVIGYEEKATKHPQ